MIKCKHCQARFISNEDIFKLDAHLRTEHHIIDRPMRLGEHYEELPKLSDLPLVFGAKAELSRSMLIHLRGDACQRLIDEQLREARRLAGEQVILALESICTEAPRANILIKVEIAQSQIEDDRYDPITRWTWRVTLDQQYNQVQNYREVEHEKGYAVGIAGKPWQEWMISTSTHWQQGYHAGYGEYLRRSATRRDDLAVLGENLKGTVRPRPGGGFEVIDPETDEYGDSDEGAQARATDWAKKLTDHLPEGSNE